MRGQNDDAVAAYYDSFSKRYEDRRGGREPFGYHDLIDDLEVDLVQRFGADRDLLEVGCGTGLLLSRFARFARSVKGLDLSDGMLTHARARGLDVVQGSVTALPFADASFDVVCAFKVLAHVSDLSTALAEMSRVTRPGGVVIAEFYNQQSLRFLAKRLGGPRTIGDGKDESSVFVRFDSPEHARDLAPPGTRVVATRGIRIVTPAAALLRIPVVRSALRRVERALADTPMSRFGGFYVVVFEKG